MGNCLAIERPRVVVLLAAFEGESFISLQLQSILDQVNVAVSVVVSVDPCRDATAAIVEEFARRDSRVRMLPMTAASGGAGQNFFRLVREVEVSNFDYVAFSDQDDIWYFDKLWRAVSVLFDTQSDCYSSNVLAFWDNGEERLIDKAQKQREWDFLFESAGPGCTYVLKRSVVERIREFLLFNHNEVSKIFLHDWFIYAFARSNSYKWTIDPRSSMAYRQHATNQVGVNSGLKAHMVRAKKIVDGLGISQARLIARLCGMENTPFCRPWRRPGRLGVLWLALNASRSRRKMVDRLIFAGACFLLSIIGDHSDV